METVNPRQQNFIWILYFPRSLCLTSLLSCSPFIPTRHITSLRYARVSFSFTTPRSGRRAEPEVRRVAREQREGEKRPPRVEHGGRRAGWGREERTTDHRSLTSLHSHRSSLISSPHSPLRSPSGSVSLRLHSPVGLVTAARRV